MQRRSSHRAPRKVYTTDAFAAIPELRDGSHSPAPTQREDETDDADEFDAAAEAHELSDEAEDLSDGDADQGDNDDEDADADADSVDSGRDHVVDDLGEAEISIKASKPRLQRPKAEARTGLTRRVIDPLRFHQYVHKPDKRHIYFGDDEDDQTAVSKTYEVWANQAVLPSQAAGFHASYVVEKEAYQQHIDDCWRWCFADGQETAIMTRQVTEAQSLADVQHVLPQGHRAFLLGPTQTPRKCSLSPQSSMLTRDAFNDKKGQERNGHVLNVGARVEGLEWVPFESGSVQHIVVATRAREAERPYRARKPPAYTPGPPFQSILQVWRMETTAKHDKAALKMLISTNFGQCKRMQFCPYAFSTTKQTPRLLATIYSDGALRVLKFPHISTDADLQILSITKVIAEYKPPDTLFTCFAWINPCRIAAGCANGFVAILDLQDLTSSTDQLQPRKYSGVARTYILEMASCAPTCPNIIVCTAMDGYIRLTDTSRSQMSAPSATVKSSRVRTPLIGCLWHDYIKSIILADDTFAVRLHLIRRISNLFTTGRTKATPTALALSPWHPFLLVGSADGTAMSLNPLVKLIEIKLPIWQQIWFTHEWRRPTEAEKRSQGDVMSRIIAQAGLVRFAEGYKPTTTVLQRTSGKQEIGIPGDVATNTVYEKESAITILRWNPNYDNAGWAAAGMADGLIRLDDLSMP